MGNRSELAAQLMDSMDKLDGAAVLQCAEELDKSGCSHYEIQSLLNQGVKRVGERFETGEYFIADLIVSGMIYRDVLDRLHDLAQEQAGQYIATVVIGVVENDIHDIGKDIVVSMMRASGFRVLDLGIDLPPECFVEAVRRSKPDILLLSGMMKISQIAMERTIAALSDAALREGVFILAGGGCIDETCGSIGADAYASTTMETLAACREYLHQKTPNEAGMEHG